MKTKTRIFSSMLALVLFLGIFSPMVMAASGWPTVEHIFTYPMSTGNDTKVYENSRSADGSYGTIFADDLVEILGFVNGRFYVAYPTSKGTKFGYVNAKDITTGNPNASGGTFTAEKDFTTYRRVNSTSTLGSVFKGDVCTIVATVDGYVQIIYPTSSGYKLGWAKLSDIKQDPVHDKYILTGIDEILFDATWYATMYPDVVKVYGTNPSNLYRHYVDFGKHEGRRPSALFDPAYYVETYRDLKAAFGYNWETLYEHFVNYGIRESRRGSAEFSVAIYKENYADLQRAFGVNSSDNWKYLQHWKMFGKNERRFSATKIPSQIKMDQFTSDSRWCAGASYGAGQTPYLSTYSASGCCAYAVDFCKYVFNSSYANGTAYYNPCQIHAGDVIKVLNSQHWIVVLSRDGNKLTTAEGNWTNGTVCISSTAYTISGNTLCRNGSAFRTFSAGYHMI